MILPPYAPTFEQQVGTARSTVDLTRGPPLPCPQQLQVNVYRCVDLWVDGNGGPSRSPCTGCKVGEARRASIASPLDGPDMVDEPEVRRWSKLDLDRAVAMLRGGATLTAASAATGVPEADIRSRLVRACLGRRSRR